MNSDKTGHSVVCDDNLNRQTFSRTYHSSNKMYNGDYQKNFKRDIFSEAKEFSKNNRPLCKFFFEKGNCNYGDECGFSHERPVCDFFQKGNCRYGDGCWKSHEIVEKVKKHKPKSPKNRVNSAGSAGDGEDIYWGELDNKYKNDKNANVAPRSKKSSEVCYHFTIGKCAYGDECYKSHEIPQESWNNDSWEEKQDKTPTKSKSNTPPRMMKKMENAKFEKEQKTKFEKEQKNWQPLETSPIKVSPPETFEEEIDDTPICVHYQRGKCDFGSKCYKRHEKMPLFKPEFAPIVPKSAACTENFNNVNLNKLAANDLDDIFMSDTESESDLKENSGQRKRGKMVSPVNIFEVLGGGSHNKSCDTTFSDDESDEDQGNPQVKKPTSPNKTKDVPKLSNAEKKKLKKENKKKKDLEAALEKIEKLRESGNEKFHDGSYSAAIKLYSDAINLCGSNNPIPAIFNNRAASYLMVDNHKAALKDARKAVEYEPENVKAHQRVVRCCIVLGRAEEGKSSLACIPPTCDKAERNMFQQKLNILDKGYTEAIDLVELKEYNAAAEKIEELMEIANKSSFYITLRAQCLAHQKKVSAAREMLSRLDMRDPNIKTSLYHFVQGLCYYYEDDFERALSGFGEGKKDLSISREWHEKTMAMHNAHINGNKEVKAGGDLNKALNFYNSGLSIDPENPAYMAKMYFNRSVVHAKLGNKTEAVEDSGRTISLDPTYYKAWAKRASLHMEDKRYGEAVRDYEEAYRLKNSPEAFRNLEDAKKKKRKNESRKPNHYLVLGLERTAGYEDIKKAYRKKAREFHPDKHANASEEEREEMEGRMKDIAAAHSCLSDTSKRKVYDEKLEREDKMHDSDAEVEDDDDDLDEFDVHDFFFQLFGGKFGVYMSGRSKKSNVYTFRR